jgi:hypothetical protein
MKGLSTATLLLIAGFTVFAGCDSMSDYSTHSNTCYVGNIIDADFVRLGAFEAGLRLKMSLDVSALAKGNKVGAVITTDDGLFVNAPVRQMLELTRDPLSLLHFPGGRTRSYLAYAPDRNANVANVVISLMENGDVEVRIFRPAIIEEDALFGVFRLSLKEGCPPPKFEADTDTDTRQPDGGEATD